MTEQEKHSNHWNWYITLHKISGGDRTKWDYYLNMNVVAFFNYLAFIKDDNKWQA